MTEQIMVEQKPKGRLVRKMRNVAIKLFIATFIVVIFMITYAAIKIGVTPELEKSPFGMYAIFFLLRIFTSDKKKLDTYRPWYKSEWGWSILILSLFIVFSLIPALLLVV